MHGDQRFTYRFTVNVTEGSKVSAPHQEWSADPGEGGNSGQVSGLLQHAQLGLSDLGHFVSEGQLPGVQLQHLDAVQHLVHQLYPVIFALHLCDLQEEKEEETNFRC